MEWGRGWANLPVGERMSEVKERKKKERCSAVGGICGRDGTSGKGNERGHGTEVGRLHQESYFLGGV